MESDPTTVFRPRLSLTSEAFQGVTIFANPKGAEIVYGFLLIFREVIEHPIIQHSSSLSLRNIGKIEILVQWRGFQQNIASLHIYLLFSERYLGEFDLTASFQPRPHKYRKKGTQIRILHIL